MNFFDFIKNETFFKPLSLKYHRIYYDCIQILIEKTKELPVLYESDAKDSITVYLKNTGYASLQSSRELTAEDAAAEDTDAWLQAP